MIMRKAIVTVDLGFGDSGKGAIVDFLCDNHAVDLVVRYSGGSQCGHNVVLNGQHHCFSQFTSGTLHKIQGYLDRNVIVDPIALVKEAEHLDTFGMKSRNYLKIHPMCLVTTKIHQAINRNLEKQYRHGSCGAGIGETRKYWLEYGADAIRVKDLANRMILIDKLELMRQRMIDKYENESYLYFDVDGIADNLIKTDVHYMVGEKPDHEFAVYEAAQGVLLDENYGFHPHTTWSSTTDIHILNLDYDVKHVLGILRAYHTRHGNGPLPTFDQGLTDHVNKEHNPTNDWQGSFRSGWLDMNMVKYALMCQPVDSLAVNCIDELTEHKVCVGYEGDFDMCSAGISKEKRAELTRKLYDVKPIYKDLDPVAVLNELCPVAISGYGRSRHEKILERPRIV